MTEPALSPALSPEGPPSSPAPTKTHGWAISLQYLGRTVADRSLRGADPVILGEDPACTVVVLGLGDAVALTLDDRLQLMPGLTGTLIHDAAETPIDGPVRLVPGDRAELRLTAHPEITLELRRQQRERLPLGTLINVRELARQLALGAGLLAGLVLLVRNQTPVNTLEVKGYPDAPADSALVRAMFAVEIPAVPLVVEHRWLPAPEPVLVESLGAGAIAAVGEAVPEPPAALLPLQAAPGEAVPLLAEPDEKPRKRKRRGAQELSSLNAYGNLYAADMNGLSGFEGGVEGGVVGGVIGMVGRDDVLAELRADAPELGVGGLGLRGVGIGGGGFGEGIRDDASKEVVEVPEVIEAPTIVDVENSDFVEGIMGPGVVDDAPVPQDMPTPAPVPGDTPLPPPGANSHPEGGDAAVVYGVVDGLAAARPESGCEDPTLNKKRQLDVVFVVDVSTTMTFMLDRIEKQIAQVDLEARTHGLDTRYGLVVFVDDVKLGNAGKPYADLAALQRDLAVWQAFTAGNRQINSADANLDWPENTLDAVHAAATDFAWRPADATLRLIVHATDDDFGEAPAIQSGQAIKHNYVQTVTALRAAEVRMFSFAAKIGGQCECLDVRPGLFARFHGRPSLPDATGGAVFDIDEVASGKLSFAAAVGGAIKSGVCSRYPLSPFGAR